MVSKNAILENNINNHTAEIDAIISVVDRNVAIFTTWPGLLEAWLVLTSVKYHGNLYILIPLNQRLALTRLRATSPSAHLNLNFTILSA